MKKIFCIATLLFVFGVLFAPAKILACEKMQNCTEMPCCKKTKISDTRVKNACHRTVSSSAKNNLVKKHPDNSQKEKTKKDCDDCDQSCCSCAPITLSFTLTPHFVLENRTFNPSKASQEFSYSKTYISSGFHFIWQPPKLV